MRSGVRKNGKKLLDTTNRFVGDVGGVVRDEMLWRRARSTPILIGATVGRDAIENKALFQLSAPVGQCNSESLIQTGIRKN